jgi:hypothetical protein
LELHQLAVWDSQRSHAPMNPSVPPQSFAFLKRMPRESTSRACICSLLCPRHDFSRDSHRLH